MDDVLILAPTRWKLREAIRVLNQTFSELKLEKHPDKTFIGRIEKGFDFLGYHFSPEGVSVAEKTIQKFLARAVRLYEQEPGEPFGSLRLRLYVLRWMRWLCGGIKLRAIDGPVHVVLEGTLDGVLITTLTLVALPIQLRLTRVAIIVGNKRCDSSHYM